MMTLQSKAPYINGWLVYMGATDRNMVLLQPDFDLPSKENWVLLDSMLRSNDYEYDPNVDNVGRSVYDSPDLIAKENYLNEFNQRQRFSINYCIPLWMWTIPLMLLLFFVWMHYSHFIYGLLIRETFDPEFGGAQSGDAIGPTTGDASKKYSNDEDFVVGSDFYFYPSPAVAPPKYNDVVEAILLGGSSDEEDNDEPLIKSQLARNDRKPIDEVNI